MKRLLLLFFAGCAFGQNPQTFNDRWIGKSEADVMLAFGRPRDSFALPNGNHLVSYRADSTAATASGRSAYVPASADVIPAFCERRFEIDPSSKVVRASINGNNCDYSR